MKRYLLLVGLVGCAAEARLPASYFAEGGNVLAAGQVAVTGVAGGGMTTDGTAGGMGGRVRVGVGDGQEIGVEAATVAIDAPGSQCWFDCGNDSENTRVGVVQRSALVSWKSQLRPELAVIVGAGYAEHSYDAGDTMTDQDTHGHSYNASLAVVRSLQLSDTVDFYAGVRASAAIPTSRDARTNDKATEVVGVSSALGFDVRISPRVHGYFEMGPRATMIFDDGPTVGLSGVGGIGLVL